MRRAFSIMIGLLSLFDCPAQAGELTEQETQAARKLYVVKCAKCHALHDPTRYDSTEWRSWMERMTKKARLKPDQTESLSRYLESIREKGKFSR